VITYGFTDGSEFRISNFIVGKKKNKFRLFRHNDLLGDFKISIPGRHNVLNATAAIIVGLELGANIGNTRKAIEKYKGAWRRFEIKGKINGITIIDDYAHHPTEIKATLKAAREKFSDKRIICVFQPHQYRRTKALFSDFIRAFTDADQVIMPEIYAVAGREKDTNLISSEQLINEIKKTGKDALYLAKLDEVVNYLTKHAKKNDVVIIMGAGNVTEVGDKLLGKLKNQESKIKITNRNKFKM
jgi:UDP-N-acetylmuramate--alanine ligase